MSGSVLPSPSPSPWPDSADGRLRSPLATRAARPTWRDPRLLVGLALVCGSVLLGVKVMAHADDTVAVLAADRPLAAGQRVDAADLTVVRMGFAAAADAERYLPGNPAGLAGAVLLRPVGAGELVPRSAVAEGGTGPLAELPLAVDAGRVPSSVRPGATVDVWVGPSTGSGVSANPSGSGAARVLTGVPVLSATRSGAGPGTLRQVVVGVQAGDATRLGRVVARLSDTGLLLVRRPG